MRSEVRTGIIRTPPSTGPYGSVRLDSWKQIAVYLNRSVRCVQRWEREEALPVLRLAHKGHASVYAYCQELDAWIVRRSRKTTTPKSDGSERRLVVFVSKEGIALRQKQAERTSWTW